jgi:valyl-tRNA synthetase
MSEISKAYEPQSVEDKWYQFWLDQKCFVADAQSKKPAYSIVIPPPNVTGVLTMGHVLNNTIQDILCRKARMDGKEVLWLPGTDHAGIATQTVVERTLKKAGEIKHRDDLGREKFLERVWQWKEKHGGIIIQQLKKLGASCDWTRERFTMDPEYSRCVQKVFVELYKKGLIYRGKRMVNWCPASLTALSDEEVVMKEQKGSLCYFKVEVVDVGQASRLSQTEKGIIENGDRRDACPTFLTIATTRPETIPGDTAVAVNPKDPRYAKFIGKHVIRPLPAELPREQKLIPIIGDEHVDFEFGTGVLKVTPAHDKADYDIFIRTAANGRPIGLIEVIDEHGKMNELAGTDLNGLDRFKARKVATEKLAELGALEKEDPYTNNVGFSERADVPIEPRMSLQWFLKYPRVEAAKASVAEEFIKFHPTRWAKVYDHWMGGLQDWCISRQLWWGHRIPVWTVTTRLEDGYISNEAAAGLAAVLQKESKNATVVQLKEDGSPLGVELWRDDIEPPQEFFDYVGELTMRVLLESPDAALEKQLSDCGFTQDPDVLDTWFSSWLWPFATMGWPEQTDTLKKFYPTTDLVTGPDIIFFWVARMIMAGYEFMGTDPHRQSRFNKLESATRQSYLENSLPFRNVYFTGIIRDKQGRKMSKSLGNSPDPLDLIGKYGADALRFGTMRSAPLGQDILFDEQNVELGRNFCNKLWNACRFRQLVGQASSLSQTVAPQGGFSEKLETGATPVLRFEVQGEIDPKLLTSDDKWILLKLDTAIREMNTAFAEYKFSDATAMLYRFFWSEYCDWYVEASKTVLSSSSRGNEAPSEKSEIGNRKSEIDQSLLTSAATEARKANTLAVIDFVLSHTLRLFHPFLPFITEELWHGMGYAEDMPENQGGKTIMFAPWPKPLDDDFKSHYGLTDNDEKQIEARNEFISQGRNLRRMANIPANKKVKFIFKPAAPVAANDIEVLKLLLNAEAIKLNVNYQPAKGALAVRAGLGELFLPTEGLIDVEAEKARLKKEQEKIESEITKVEQKLANPNFTQKVPANVLEEHMQRLAGWQGKLARVKTALAALEN